MREMALLNSFDVGSEGSIKPVLSSRGRSVAPIVRVGIPPPGAIILNSAQAPVTYRTRGTTFFIFFICAL